MVQLIKKKWFVLPAVVLAVVLLWFAICFRFSGADGEKPVEIKEINYETMEAKILYNGNTNIYYSTDKKTWNEAEGMLVTADNTNGNTAGTIDTSALLYDISWNSSAKETAIYFRGNIDTTTATLTIPAYNTKFKAKFDKSTGDVDFSNTEGATIIRWRKTTDYTWHYVNIDSSDTAHVNTEVENIIGSSKVWVDSYDTFLTQIDGLRTKGAKIHCQTAPKVYQIDSNGTVTDQGMRPSKEVKVSITARRKAPTVKVNVKKMTVNTKATQEWTTAEQWDSVRDAKTQQEKDQIWKSCTKTMKVSALAPTAVDSSVTGKDATIYIRLQSTSSNTASKIAIVEIPKRAAKPATPASLVQVPGKKAGKGKAQLTFTNVPAQGYQYYVQKSAGAFDETAVSWKTVKKAKTIKLSEKSAPAGSVIYMRIAGVAQNANKNIALQLPSDYISMKVGSYPAPTSSK